MVLMAEAVLLAGRPAEAGQSAVQQADAMSRVPSPDFEALGRVEPPVARLDFGDMELGRERPAGQLAADMGQRQALARHCEVQ